MKKTDYKLLSDPDVYHDESAIKPILSRSYNAYCELLRLAEAANKTVFEDHNTVMLYKIRSK